MYNPYKKSRYRGTKPSFEYFPEIRYGRSQCSIQLPQCHKFLLSRMYMTKTTYERDERVAIQRDRTKMRAVYWKYQMKVLPFICACPRPLYRSAVAV